MSSLTNDDKLNLKKMVGEMDGVVDNTKSIRTLKHSILLRDDIRKLDTIRKTDIQLFTNDFDSFMEKCQHECRFLYNNYTDIFNRVIKQEIDLEIMTRFLFVLKLIEDGDVNQHEGSAMIGKILKELYLDSAIKCADNLRTGTTNELNQPTSKLETKDISWKEYKQKRL